MLPYGYGGRGRNPYGYGGARDPYRYGGGQEISLEELTKNLERRIMKLYRRCREQRLPCTEYIAAILREHDPDPASIRQMTKFWMDATMMALQEGLDPRGLLEPEMEAQFRRALERGTPLGTDILLDPAMDERVSRAMQRQRYGGGFGQLPE